MIDYHTLPAVNAILNATATVLLLWGYTMIRQRRQLAHQRIMISAFVVSTLFLISYLVYHAHVGSVKYTETGILRIIYYTILLTHVLLAFAVPPLAILSLWRGWTAQYAKHRRISKITFPVWLYVSVTGVIVYLMLYQF